METPSKYITLVSGDNYEFVVLREAAYISPAIKSMLNTQRQFAEARTGRVFFEEISGVVLEKVVEYFQYWYKNKDKVDVQDMEVPPELCLELLMAADFLGLDTPMFEEPARFQEPSNKPHLSICVPLDFTSDQAFFYKGNMPVGDSRMSRQLSIMSCQANIANLLVGRDRTHF